MDNNQVEQLIAMYGSRLPIVSLQEVRQMLITMDFGTGAAYMSQLKDPTISILLSVFTGALGVDRFYIGDIGMGVLKLITGGGCCVWWLIDLFLIMDKTRQKNLEQLYTITGKHF